MQSFPAQSSSSGDLLDVKFVLVLNRKLEPFSLRCINNDFKYTTSPEASCIMCFVNYLMATETEKTPRILFSQREN